MENFIDASCILWFHHWVYAVGVLHMSHALVQRKFINLCQPLLRNLDFACRLYPQFASESHDIVVLSRTLVLLSSLVGNLEPNSRHFIIGRWLGGFPCVRRQDIYSHIGIPAVPWMPLALLVVSSPLSVVFLIGLFFVYRLHLAHVKDAQGHWFVNMFFIRFPPNYEAPTLYLVMNDERCLNSLLSAGLFPSTSAHLFWKWDLGSYEYLDNCSHQS